MRLWCSEDDFASYHCARCGLSGWSKPDDEPFPRTGGRPASSDAQRARFAQRQEREDAEAKEKLRRSAWAEFTFLSAQGAAGTVVDRYLASRAITLGDDLRFSPWAPLTYGDTPPTMPGMIAAVRDVAGAIIGAHCTYISDQAQKTGRKCFGRVGGGAIRLAPIGQDGELAIAEGIETARSFSILYGVPCWSAISAPGIETFALPSDLQRLVIAADADANGRGLEAAQRLAKRACQSCEVQILMPKAGDWADELMRRGKLAA